MRYGEVFEASAGAVWGLGNNDLERVEASELHQGRWRFDGHEGMIIAGLCRHSLMESDLDGA